MVEKETQEGLGRFKWVDLEVIYANRGDKVQKESAEERACARKILDQKSNKPAN